MVEVARCVKIKGGMEWMEEVCDGPGVVDRDSGQYGLSGDV